MTTAATTTARGRGRTSAYWVITAAVIAECAIGGTMDLLRMPPFYPAMIALGYPGYLATILGTAKLLAAVVLLAPRLPRLKEWAYAGVLINMTGAAASYIATRQSATNLIPPAVVAGLALLSWALRPATVPRVLVDHVEGAAYRGVELLTDQVGPPGEVGVVAGGRVDPGLPVVHVVVEQGPPLGVGCRLARRGVLVGPDPQPPLVVGPLDGQDRLVPVDPDHRRDRPGGPVGLVDDEGAAALAGHDQPLGVQHLQRGLHGGPGHLVLLGQLVLGGQLLTGGQVARSP